MLFNSYAFIFLFLPVAWAGYFAVARFGNLAPVVWLALASLAFYAVSNWQFVGLLLASVAFNYVIGLLLISKRLARPVASCDPGHWRHRRSRNARLFQICRLPCRQPQCDLFDQPHDRYPAAGWNLILYLHADRVPGRCLQGKVARYALPHYALFVTYFPHLIAGPILHHKDMIPQFESAAAKRPNPHLMLCGLVIFAIGLFKKTCLADGIQPLVGPAFGANSPSFDQAWIGALAYTFQLYFDFSGYCDMAIGISLMFGIFLPLNFNSPYKATSIIDFWRRWHMTLSQFLRDYLYIPLGGNRRGRIMRYVNLMITMLLGGLWHGAAWTFVVWGALHGVYLCINHAWNNYGPAIAPRFEPAAKLAGCVLTFAAVVVAWVFFRADSLSSAWYVVSRMAEPWNIVGGRDEIAHALFIAAYAAIAWFAPNTQAIMGYDHENRTVGEGLVAWLDRPAFIYASAAALAFGILGIQQHSEFIYFRF